VIIYEYSKQQIKNKGRLIIMITTTMIKENLLKIKNVNGDELENEIICAFEDFEQNGKNEVIVSSVNEGWNCAYINTDNSTEFKFLLTKDTDKEGMDYLYSIIEVR
jgi:hypothetical protein